MHFSFFNSAYPSKLVFRSWLQFCRVSIVLHTNRKRTRKKEVRLQSRHPDNMDIGKITKVTSLQRIFCLFHWLLLMLLGPWLWYSRAGLCIADSINICCCWVSSSHPRGILYDIQPKNPFKTQCFFSGRMTINNTECWRPNSTQWHLAVQTKFAASFYTQFISTLHVSLRSSLLSSVYLINILFIREASTQTSVLYSPVWSTYAVYLKFFIFTAGLHILLVSYI